MNRKFKSNCLLIQDVKSGGSSTSREEKIKRESQIMQAKSVLCPMKQIGFCIFVRNEYDEVYHHLSRMLCIPIIGVKICSKKVEIISLFCFLYHNVFKVLWFALSEDGTS